MHKAQKQVLDFHKKYGHLIGKFPIVPDDKTLLLRSRLIVEEAAEFVIAASRSNLDEMCDALADLLYVVYGTAISLGVDMEPVLNEVHRSNMTKDGGKEGSGKTMKGVGFAPPRIAEALQQSWPKSPQ